MFFTDDHLVQARAISNLCARFDKHLSKSGYLAKGGQIVDATLIAAPKQRNSDGEKAAIKEGKTADEIWPDKPAKAAQKDTDARLTVKFSKARPDADGMVRQRDIAIPAFGYKDHSSIDRHGGFIRGWAWPISPTISPVTSGTRGEVCLHDGKPGLKMPGTA